VWESIINTIPIEERNWLDAPYLISEFYFYRRVIDAFDYFSTNYDMFHLQKQQGLNEATKAICDASLLVSTLLSKSNTKSEALHLMEFGLLTSLWGNKMDLSLWPAGDMTRPELGTDDSHHSAQYDKLHSYILDNQLSAVCTYLCSSISSCDVNTSDVHVDSEINNSLNDSSSINQSDTNNIHLKYVNIIVDNAGYEIFTDLLLGYILLKLGVTTKVVLHTKAHPTFVSDATTTDVMCTIDFMSQILSRLDNNNISREVCQCAFDISREMALYLTSGAMECQSDLYWCQPFEFWNMPNEVANKFINSQLTVVKGDANYRRLLGDRYWSWDTPSKEALSYWTSPVCALRTLKSEIGCGISNDAQAYASARDSKWQVSGRWGLIQTNGLS
jgi:hypothetical protein